MQVVNVLVVLALAFGCATSDTVNINGLIDQVLTSVNELVGKAGFSSIALKPVSKEWHQKWHFISVSEYLTCDNGHAGTFNTLKRVGDASMSTNGNTITLKAGLGLGDLSAGITCRYKVHNILSVHSTVEAQVDSEAISFQLSVTHGPNNQCGAKLDHISLDSIGKVSIKTGGGVFNKVLDKLLDVLVNIFTDDAKTSINLKLPSVAQAAVEKNAQKLCQALTHL